MREEIQHSMPMTEVPARQIPGLRYAMALGAGIRQIMMTTWGGLGDQVCGEPALRYAFKLYPDYKISLYTSFPELFKHMPFQKIYSKDQQHQLKDDEWLTLHTNSPHNNMSRDFLAHHFTQCVDFSTLCAFQRQLPLKDRHVQLQGDKMEQTQPIVIHPGRHWQSKTFPKSWWNGVIKWIVDEFGPENVCIVGKDIDKDTGTVDVDTAGAIDLRNKLSLRELVTVCKAAKVILTNDSAPLHIGAAGDAWVLFVASCKESEHLLHWRYGKWAWRMEALELDGLWNHIDTRPVRETPLSIDTMPNWLLYQLLPTPYDVLERVKAAYENYGQTYGQR